MSSRQIRSAEGLAGYSCAYSDDAMLQAASKALQVGYFLGKIGEYSDRMQYGVVFLDALVLGSRLFQHSGSCSACTVFLKYLIKA